MRWEAFELRGKHLNIHDDAQIYRQRTSKDIKEKIKDGHLKGVVKVEAVVLSSIGDKLLEPFIYIDSAPTSRGF